MSRRAKGPRLYLDPSRKQWVIRDGSSFVRTGCPADDTAGAEKQLAEYIGIKHKPESSGSPLIADVLTVYAREHVPHTRTARDAVYHIANLARWFGALRVSDITASRCREYAAARANTGARRDLEVLRASVHYWHREYGPIPSLPTIPLPSRRPARARWLTRSEAASLLWHARQLRHLARFILLGLYTGSRSGVILRLRWDQIDLSRGIMARTRQGEVASDNKRSPPVRLGKRILSHLRRWHRMDTGSGYLVRYGGLPISTNIKKSWQAARLAADLDASVTPHCLRRTRATWMMQAGIDMWEAAGALGMSVEMLERTYGQHHPDFQKRAAEV